MSKYTSKKNCNEHEDSVARKNTIIIWIIIITLVSLVIGYKTVWYAGILSLFIISLFALVAVFTATHGIPKIERNAVGIVVKTKKGAVSISASSIRVRLLILTGLLVFATLCVLAILFHK